MTFELLPRINVTWDASAEDPAVFQYWSVYRQRLDEPDTLVRLAVIRQMDVLFYESYTVESGQTYQWYLTQTIDNGSDLIESDFAGPVQASVTCRSVFLHDVAAPQHYVELQATAIGQSHPRDVSFLRARSSEADVAFVGTLKGQAVSVGWKDTWLDDEEYEAALLLLDRMVDNGSTMMLRHMTVPGMFCVIANDLGRSIASTTHEPTLAVRRVKYEEAV